MRKIAKEALDIANKTMNAESRITYSLVSIAASLCALTEILDTPKAPPEEFYDTDWDLK